MNELDRLKTGGGAPPDRRREADLVVVGHRHSAAGTAFGRTVGEHVASRHKGPVLVVRVPGWPPGPDFATRPIVVGVDDSAATTAAIDFAIAEARLRQCDVIMLDATGAHRHRGERLERSEDIVIHHRVIGADPVSELLGASGHAAALVVGRHGRGGLAETPLGSITRTMIQRRLPGVRAGMMDRFVGCDIAASNVDRKEGEQRRSRAGPTALGRRRFPGWNGRREWFSIPRRRVMVHACTAILPRSSRSRSGLCGLSTLDEHPAC